MKKKQLIFVILLVLVTTSAWTQSLGGGLMLGPAFSTMSISGNDSTTFRTGLTGGVRIALIPERSIIGAEIDILYSRQGTSSKKGLDANNNSIRYLEKSHYINVPLLLNIYLRKWNEDDEDESMIPRLRIGPQIGFCVGGNEVQEVKGKKKQQYITPWEPGSFNRIDYGFTAAYECEASHLFTWKRLLPVWKKSTICLAAAIPALTLASAVCAPIFFGVAK